MRAMAPGKLLLTGAYAVLEGAPAVVVAVDRYAVADASRPGRHGSPEVRAALGDELAPEVDVRALHDENGRKLGLGSSAAALVASLGARALALGEDLGVPSVRMRLFRAAREAHTRAQGGGSGVDVAASVHGGVLRYAIDSNGTANVRALDLPRGVVVRAYDSGTSARTSDMRARFDALRVRPTSGGLLRALCQLAAEAAAAVEAGDARSFVASARQFGRALTAVGQGAGSPIVPHHFAELASLAEREDGAFLPSGAGGGDVAVWLGTAPPSEAFESSAEALSMRPLALGIDCGGLRPDCMRTAQWPELPDCQASTR
jgi:phosphomevalonate kinase